LEISSIPAFAVSRKFQNILSGYLLSAMFIFTLSAAGKLLSDFTAEEMTMRDSFISFLTNRQLLFSIAIIEVVITVLIGLNVRRSPTVSLGLTLWLSSLFLLYRIGFWLAPGNPGTCKCFGVGGVLGKHVRADSISLLLLTYLLVIGGILFFMTREVRSTSLANPHVAFK